MEFYEFEGKTTEEAIEQACEHFHISNGPRKVSTSRSFPWAHPGSLGWGGAKPGCG